MDNSNGSKFKNYLSLVKFSHTIFAMPFALIGISLAYKTAPANFSWQLLVLVILCMVLARNAAMSFNRLVDRYIDKKNPRTAEREIPKGIISAKSALLFIILNSILFIVTTWFINDLVFYLSPIALAVILLYSFTKRWTILCHLVLGLGLSLAPIGAYLSVTGRFDLIPILYSLIVLFWVSGFDIIYSLQDEEFDKNESLKSIPAALGLKNALRVAVAFHIFTALLTLLVGYYLNASIWYWAGAIIFIVLLVYQHSIVSPKDIKRVNLAFATTNGFASIIFAIFNILNFLL
ncbi:MAG: 4-hydroxybenzoate octaprenyltransferase [Bacteroidales bacterium]|nr:MAG: 4-hydroxybenzoate octaprenyltransferase [Bacteroidales bacterium]